MSGVVDPASGSVISVTGGWSELSSIMDACVRHSRALVVDYYATWCGPCRALAPALESLAREHVGRACFVKVDCEGSPANAQLARQESVSAFPTIAIFAGRERVDLVRGADLRRIQAALRDATLRVARTANMVPKVLAALQTLKADTEKSQEGPSSSSSSPSPSPFAPSAFVTACRTLLSCAENVLAHPSEPKYRRIREGNAAVRARLLRWRGGGEALDALGFARRVEASESLFAMDDVPADLERVVRLLAQAVEMGQAADAAARERAEKERKEKEDEGGKEEGSGQQGARPEREVTANDAAAEEVPSAETAVSAPSEAIASSTDTAALPPASSGAAAPSSAPAPAAPAPVASSAPAAPAPVASSAPAVPAPVASSASVTRSPPPVATAPPPSPALAALPPGLASGPLAAWAATASAPSSPSREAQRNITAKVCAKLLEKLMLQAEEDPDKA